MRVQDGHFATPIPHSLNHGSVNLTPLGAASYEGNGLSALKGEKQEWETSPSGLIQLN